MWGFGRNPKLADLFKDGDDAELVETIALIVQEMHLGSKAKRLAEEHLHVMWVWETAGRCSNGGIQCLFGDPLNISERVAGLEAIGALEAAQRIRDVVALFPEGKPHPSAKDRHRFLEGLEQSGSLPSASPLYDDAIVPPLSDYVRERESLFLKLPNIAVPRFFGPPKKVRPPGEAASTLDVAAWILSRSGYVQFHELKHPHGGRKLFTSGDPPPKRPLTLAAFRLHSHRRDAKETLHILGRWKGRFGVEAIQLEQVRFVESCLESLQAFPQLKDLDLTKTRIGNRELPLLAALPKLQSLDLAWTKVTEPGLAALAPFGSLSSLNLKGMEISGTWLRTLRQVTDLSIGNAPLKDDHLGFLSGLSNLARLEIAGMALTRKALRQIASCPHLESLTLLEAVLSEEDLAELSGNGTLATFNLYGNPRLTVRGAQFVLNLPALRKLGIWNEQLEPAAKELLLKERPALLEK